MATHTPGDHPRGDGVHTATRRRGDGGPTDLDTGRDVARLVCMRNGIMRLSINDQGTRVPQQMAARVHPETQKRSKPRQDSLLNEYFSHFLELEQRQWKREEDELVRSLDAKYLYQLVRERIAANRANSEK